MKRTLLLCAFVLAAFLVGCDTTTDPPEPKPTEAYVPLARGNEWDYAWDLPEDGEAMNWYVTGYENGAWRVEFTWGDTAEDWLWRHTDEGEFQARPADEENWRTYLKTPIRVGTEWTFTDDEGVLWEGRIGDTEMVFDTPAGYFDDCVWVAVYEYERPDDYVYIENYWFVENVGIIRVAVADDERDQDAKWQWLLNFYSLK